MEHKNRPTSVPADPEQWSASSKKSLVYQDFAPQDYADLHYFCRHCGARALYTAQEQKHDYEILKAYIWRRRLLCADCWAQHRRLKKEIQQYAERWRNEKAALEDDVEFLEGWCRALRAYGGYDGHEDSGTIAMLQKLLGRSI